MRHKPATVYGGKVGAKPRPPLHTAPKATTKLPFKCIDGPMRGTTLYLQQDGATLPLHIQGQVGRYISGYWEAL